MSARTRWLLVCATIILFAAGWATAVGIAQQRAAALMATSAQTFLTSLTPEQRQKATFPLTSDEYTRWHFIPVTQFERHGLPIKEMTEPQRQRAHDLLKASLSQAGYATSSSIMALESILREIEAAARGGAPGGIPRDPEMYFFSVFGEPSAQAKWGWRVEGHHLSLHFAIDGAKLSIVSAPLFFGSNPAEVRQGPQTGLRILGAQEDTARALLGALDDAQRATTIIAPAAPGDIATMTTVKVDPLNPSGLAAAQMTPAQRDLLMKIVETYTSAMLPEVATERMAKVRAAGLDKIAFAWFGPTEKGQRYYYRVQGPTFLIEHNNTQNNGNHIHSVWRDFNGDFGRDILGEHLSAFPH